MLTHATTDAFALPDHLAAKADPALIDTDEEHFAAIAESLERSIADLTDRLDAARRAPGGTGQQALDRDQEVHRLTARLRTLRRFSLDLCLGRMVSEDDPEPVYVGRLGLTDAAGRRVLVDWRSPAAEPFFGATHANPMGLTSRRRYRWTRGRITDYWDEVFDPAALVGHAALDDQSAFIASLGGSRSGQMQDVLATIQADQDAIIRAGSRGALVVDGGPGTGKTVVALHRSAYLLYADPRLGEGRGGILFVGPHRPYLAYVADVLPSLGEEGVQTCTLRDLVPEGAAAAPETDPDVARLKATAAMVTAIEPAVRLYEEPPTDGHPGRDRLVGGLAQRRRLAGGIRVAGSGHAAQRGAGPGLGGAAGHPDRQARRPDDRDEVSPALLRRSFARNEGLTDAFHRAWPLIDPDRPGRRPVDGAGLPADVRAVALPRRGQGAAARGRPGLDHRGPAAAGRRAAAARRSRSVTTPATPGGGARRRAEADGRGRRPPDRHRRHRDEGDVDAARPGRPERPRRRDRRPDRRPGPARRSVRAHRRRRGAGADRRGVADAPPALPLAQLHHRRRPRAGQARVHGVVAGAARADRSGPHRAGVADASTTGRPRR